MPEELVIHVSKATARELSRYAEVRGLDTIAEAAKNLLDGHCDYEIIKRRSRRENPNRSLFWVP